MLRRRTGVAIAMGGSAEAGSEDVTAVAAAVAATALCMITDASAMSAAAVASRGCSASAGSTRCEGPVDTATAGAVTDRGTRCLKL